MDVREAAARTLAAGSARVSQEVFLDPPVTNAAVALVEFKVEGVADLANRRARVDRAESPGMDRLVERVTRKYPWLDDDEDEGDDDEQGFTSVLIGSCRFAHYDGRWTKSDGGDPRGPRDSGNPTWILDALGGAEGARRAGLDTVRGEPCERFALEPVDLRAAAEGCGHGIALMTGGSLERPTLRGEVWIDPAGLVRRVRWMQPARFRRRARPRETPPTLWHITELWEFGLPVTIDIPVAEPPPDPGPVLKSAWEAGTWLWRKRRDYRRRTGA